MVSTSTELVQGCGYTRHIPGELLLSSSGLCLDGCFIGWHTQSNQPIESDRPATTEHQFVLYESAEEQGEYQYNHGLWRKYTKRTNDWYIAPANENSINWRSVTTHATNTPSIFRIHITPKKLHANALDVFSINTSSIALDHRMNIQDSFMAGLAGELKSELKNPCNSSHLYIEQLIETFSAYILKRYCKFNTEAINRLPMLSLKRKHDLIDYIHDNIGNELALAELADLACLSKYHFARAFKETFRITPHSYVLKCRIEHASSLLKNTDLPISIIAEQCGFSSASRFSKVFSNLQGISPNQYRLKD
ncbi:helix-turn-helix transcriptional regulator [Nitrincola iocasae]|uniref:Helix-turn-helix transcriptional regulator n=1 Tax=Nitrincola iocasae TaxID=2614693 RepID=A0A5J6LH34_9GAMM|nr:helix-turn-helix transcriptional regulator [Nitrincola iocasae]QEW07845.1 helix-turn-helix transcriptional regulator [Nitrincola iocasae]